MALKSIHYENEVVVCATCGEGEETGELIYAREYNKENRFGYVHFECTEAYRWQDELLTYFMLGV